MKATTFTIDRSKWARGGRDTTIRLLNAKTQRMCCLGFYALACGLEPCVIEGKSEYRDVDHEMRGALPDDLIKFDHFSDCDEMEWFQTAVCDALMSANDDDCINDLEREQKVRSYFGNIGVTVDFIDGEA